ncbi:galactose ABC transporter substrate-binding protein [Lacrimispora sp.]|uniref:galactose ABC transporter substrate-binding protein n=1 Tax=Lacrimispora sp. TaxID=2719234 RepID=UPI00289652B0|nr:galactose ABC transporter substrate-binding protein [Lacrimispora sp.]
MKRLSKRIFVFFLIVWAAFLLYGCAPREQEKNIRESSASEAGTEEVREETGPKIGISIYRYDDTFMKLYRSELKQYLEETYHAEVIMRNAGGDQEEQNRQIGQFISDGCDGIIVNPVEVSAATGLVNACSQAGVPLVFINREPKEEEQKRWHENHMAVSCVGTDSRQAGTYQGEIILELPDKGDINGDGVVSYAMFMGEEGNEDSRYRTEYSIKALEEGGMKTDKLFSGNGDWNKDKGKKLAQEVLASYGSRIEVIFCNNDSMANGALEAVEEAGRVPGKDIYLVGVDALQDTVKYIKEGKIAGTVLNDHQGQSQTAADTLTKLIDGEDVDTRYLVDYIKVTAISTFHTLKGED